MLTEKNGREGKGKDRKEWKREEKKGNWREGKER